MNRRRAFSCAIFAVNDGRVLLILHNRLKCWLPVGGEIEIIGSDDGAPIFETPLEAAKRELKEETGLDGQFPPSWFSYGPFGFVGYEEHDAGSKGLHMNFNFMCYVDSDTVKSDGSFDDWVWLTAREVALLDNVPKNVKRTVMMLNLK
jgi:8-oxo-dGTP diphosphatase